METIYGLTPAEARELPVAIYLRYIITRSTGDWTSKRAQDALEIRGWDTTSSYPRNFAGNLLTRFKDKGAMVSVGRGVYRPLPETMHAVQVVCAQRARTKISSELYAKVLAWTPDDEPWPWE